jgi:hypothetical protein
LALVAALRNQDKLFIKTAMAAKRRNSRATRIAHPTSWTIRGDVQVANEPRGSLASLAALASRFALEPRGRWKTAVARPVNAIGLSMASGGLESEPHAHRESQLMCKSWNFL